MTSPVVIAVDGPAASGKGTLARRLAAHYGLRHLDTGLLYRAVGLIAAVRAALRPVQHRFAADPPGAVLDGRDIGTVVFPDAPVKLYVDADLEDRARRRHKELIGRGLESIYSRVLQDMKERDARDRARTVAPLTPAKDALVIDSSRLDADAVFARAVGYVNRVLPDLASGSSRA